MLPVLTPFAWIIIAVGGVSLIHALVSAAQNWILDRASRRPEDQSRTPH